MSETRKRTIKTINIDADKCNGCRACEVICSSFHAMPPYSSNNPARSRVRVVRDPLRDIYIPLYAGDYTESECMGRDKFVIDGKEYDECGFCRTSCPSRDLFREPDSGLPLKCDLCDGEPEPLCVKWCLVGALSVTEREIEEPSDEQKHNELEVGLQSLMKRFGTEKLLDTVGQITKG
ncbi:Fe-S-cluster-containing hydrogenase components 2 [Citrifermentans bremense]|uniref:Fe-S-cluster-containing hydrogenase components 2 n=1 Tax=Citrifermentans bremense TaxID=60035 RepID=A0A6S6M1J7_9BACT|nr:(4Fe-4S)-binding protein [Citrifermentans bremense]BCG48227.1 Fe-S-cluster-containing hydrogenase components 2 [Citrifermentans bremense]